MTPEALAALYADQARRLPVRAARHLAGLADVLEDLPPDAPKRDHLQAVADAITSALDAAGRCRGCGHQLQTADAQERHLGSSCLRRARAS